MPALIFRTLLAVSFASFLDTSVSLAVWQEKSPNIILVNFDDADAEMLSLDMLNAHYPTLASIANRSTTFTNAHCTTPFCAPSRAALFTGKYGFSNGCKTGSERSSVSNGFNGGYARYTINGHKNENLGVWMKRAGYRTIHVGKFHHDKFDFQVPPGWDDISVSNGVKFFDNFKFTNIEFPQPRAYASGENTYVAHVDRRHALIALHRQMAQRPDQPFFLSLAPLAPHYPAERDVTRMVEPYYANYASELSQPIDVPDFDEDDMSDKPAQFRRGPLSEREKYKSSLEWISRLRAVKSVDDMLAQVLKRIDTFGQLDNTYIIISSDNGYQLGHHRMYSKIDPYNRSTNIPLIVAGPGGTDRKSANHLIAHIDICATILELGHAQIPADLDGKSFLPLIEDPESIEGPDWRRSIMIENWADKDVGSDVFSAAYTAERYYDSVFVGWANGDREFYDLASDPFQLENIWPQLSSNRKEELQDSLSRFRQVESSPNLTITTPPNGSDVGSNIEIAGVIEDNSAALATMLRVRSNATGRYFNGSTWQDESSEFLVPGQDPKNPVNLWQTNLRIFTEPQNGIDLLTISARALDDNATVGSWKETTHSSDGNSLFAAFNPTINGRTYSSGLVKLNGYMGTHPGASVGVSIFRGGDSRFYNGSGFQDGFARVKADLLVNNRWRIFADLPPGYYRAFALGLNGPLYQAQPAFVNFRVE